VKDKEGITYIIIEQLGDIQVTGDVQLKIKRSFSILGKIELEFYEDGNLILTAYEYQLNPFKSIIIEKQNLPKRIEIHNTIDSISYGDDLLTLNHNHFYIISSRLCTIYLNNQKLLSVNKNFSGLKLKLDMETVDHNLKIIVVLLIILNYYKIDKV